MTYQFCVVENSSMPARFKESLVNILRFIQSNEPVGLKQVLLFGSLARSSITCRSDIDICLVFEDGTDIDSYNMRVFRGYLRGSENHVDADVVFLYESQLASESQRLYQEINRDKIVLGRR